MREPRDTSSKNFADSLFFLCAPIWRPLGDKSTLFFTGTSLLEHVFRSAKLEPRTHGYVKIFTLQRDIFKAFLNLSRHCCAEVRETL